MENFTPITSLLGGMLIGLSVSLFLLFNGRMAGISGIMNGLLAPKDDHLWRYLFLVGLIIGTFLFQFFSNTPISVREGYPLILIIVGGFLVGFGTKMSNGCTSGHGICGMANFSMRSIIATITFMVSGMITVFILKHLLGV